MLAGISRQNRQSRPEWFISYKGTDANYHAKCGQPSIDVMSSMMIRTMTTKITTTELEVESAEHWSGGDGWKELKATQKMSYILRILRRNLKWKWEENKDFLQFLWDKYDLGENREREEEKEMATGWKNEKSCQSRRDSLDPRGPPNPSHLQSTHKVLAAPIGPRLNRVLNLGPPLLTLRF